MAAWLRVVLGLNLKPEELSFLQISLRGVVIFFIGLVLVRLSDRRSLTRKSPFDIILLVVLASVLARAVNGSASFFPTIGAAAVLVFLHRLLAIASSRWRAVAVAVKGTPTMLVRDGTIQKSALRRKDISEEDLMEDMRLNAQCEEMSEVKAARLEVSGDISFITKEGKA